MSKKSKESRKKLEGPNRPLVIIASDPSLYRGAFAVLSYEPGSKVKVERVFAIDNSSASKRAILKRSEILSEIYYTTILNLYMFAVGVATQRRLNITGDIYAVREAGFTRHVHTTKVLNMVAGTLELSLRHGLGKEWDEIAPVSVKALVTGNGRSDKERVAVDILGYIDEDSVKLMTADGVGEDETDAVAVGIAWLIQNGCITPEYNNDTKKGEE